MKNAPLISVVLPVYNVAPYIKEALDSVLNQTIQDFEIIVIDDCSTDNTLEVIESIKDARIRIIKKSENKGLIDSLNIGFTEAKGEFIARMDGDDLNTPDRFEKQLHILQNNSEITACGCWLQCFGTSNKIIKHKQYHKEIQAHLLLSNSMSLGATMLKTSAYRSFKFDETKLHAEDYDFWAKTAWESKMYNIQEVLYLYRVHDKQVSTKHKSIQIQGDIEIKLFLFKKLKYDTVIFTDVMITKLLLLNKPIEIKEIKLFLKWIKTLIYLNKKVDVYSQSDFKNVLNEIKKVIIFKLYFTSIGIKISKKWRFQTLLILPLEDILYVLKLKFREKKKLIFKVKH